MEKFQKYLIIFLLAVLALVGGAYLWEKRSHQNDNTDYQNQIAKQAETIRVKDGVVEKLVIQSDNLKTLIDRTTEQGQQLEQRLNETKSKLATVVNSQIELKKLVIEKGYTPIQQSDGTWRVDVDERNGPLYAKGYITGGPTVNDKVFQNLTLGVDQLRFTTTVSQNKDGSWSADFAAPPGVDVKISVAAVNPYIFQPRWYEKIQLNFHLAGGQTGLLAGLGAAYKIYDFDVGPVVFATTSKDVFFGGSVSWYPLEKGK